MSVTGCHRKHVIRVLKRKKRVDVEHKKKRGRKSKYEFPEFVKSLRLVWRETEFMCSKLLKSAMREWLSPVEKHYGKFSPEVRELLMQISPATMGRILKPYKCKPKSGTKPGSLLRTEIQFRGASGILSSQDL